MLYTVYLNDDNYILSVAHTNHDDTELNLEAMETEFLNCYQLTEEGFALDETKKAQMIGEDKEKREAENREKYLSNLVEDEKGNLYKVEAINGTNTLVLVEDNGGKLYI